MPRYYKDRTYIGHWFDEGEEPKEGDTIVYEMPPFCSGDYTAEVHADEDGDLYIDKSDNWYKGCRDFFVVSRESMSK